MEPDYPYELTIVVTHANDPKGLFETVARFDSLADAEECFEDVVGALEDYRDRTRKAH